MPSPFQSTGGHCWQRNTTRIDRSYGIWIDPLLPIRLVRRFWRKLTTFLPPGELALLAGATAVLAWAFRWMTTVERREQAGRVVVAVTGLLLLESILWSSQGDVPAGLFHPTLAGFTFRLYEILIPLALAARLAVRGAPRRCGVPSLWWTAFATWYAASAIVGVMAGHETKEVVFEAKAIAYVAGGYALAAGVPVQQYLDRSGVLRLTVPAAIGATVVIFLNADRRYLSGGIPGIRFESFGNMGADSASLLVALALVTLWLLACRERRPVRFLVAAGPLLASALIARQRAALLGLVVSGGVLILSVLTPTARRRLRATPTEMTVVAMVVGALLLVPLLFRTAVERRDPALPFAEELHATFSGPGNEQSAQQRINQYRATIDKVTSRPLTGWGLGATITYYATGQNEYKHSPIAHNIGADLLIRTGIVGLVFFAVPVALVVAGGFRTWRYHPDDAVAGFALVCSAVVLGLIGKGMVESIFEKYRLAVALGLFLGMTRSATVSVPHPGKLDHRQREVTHRWS